MSYCRGEIDHVKLGPSEEGEREFEAQRQESVDRLVEQIHAEESKGHALEAMFEDQVTRLSRVAGQLYGDLKAITDEQQALARIFDAFETVGIMAIESAEAEKAGIPYEEYVKQGVVHQ